MPEHKEFEGKNLDVAVWNASQEIGIPIEELRYQILHKGRRAHGDDPGQPARIRVLVGAASEPADGVPESSGGDVREEVPHDQEEEADVSAEEELEEPPSASATTLEEDDPIEMAREVRRARSGREKAPPTPSSRERPRPDRPRPRSDRRRPRPDGALDPDDLEAGLERAREIVPELVKAMGFDLEVDAEIQEDHVYVPLRGEDCAYLLEHRAEGLNALQFLVNKMVYRGGPTRILVDADGYRKERQEELVQRARRVADEVRDSGHSRSLGSLNPFERRLVHMALRDDGDVRTVSKGEGFLKRMEILPRHGGREPHPPERRPRRERY